jgi:hypothetical protein
MQVKTTLRFYITSVRIATIKNTNNNKCWQGFRKKKPSYTTGGKVVKPLCKTVWKLKKLKIDLPYDTAIPHLGRYPKQCKSVYNKLTCKPMFTAALFTIAKL